LARRLPGTGKSKRPPAETDADRPRLPPVFAAEVMGRDKDGELLAVPLDWDAGEPPKIHLHMNRRERRPPGIGDRVLLKLERRIDRWSEGLSARVLKVLDAKPRQILGVFRKHRDGAGRVSPVDKKSAGREISIPANATEGADDGELVAVEVRKDTRLGLSTGRIVERLGAADGQRAVSRIAIQQHDIPEVFSDAALKEADSAKAATLKGREDWRALPLITIDPIDAKDHDDAVHAAQDQDPANEGGFVVSVAIADVAAYVLPGSALDSDAVERGNSVYFPDRVVPMLPERISNDLCSLRPNEDRPALAVRMVIDRHGRKQRHTFHRILMRSHAKLAYEQAQAAIDGKADKIAEPLLEPVLKPLYAAYRALAKARDGRNPLAIDMPERKIILNDMGQVKDVAIRERLDAHRLIEEMMILANVAAAETLIDLRQPLLFRVHDEPPLDKLESLRTFLRSLEVDLPKAGAVQPVLFNRILERFAGTEHNHVINEVVLRSQAQAEYAPENRGHFGLNLRRYAHFTSPIRRYADLIVHRALIKALNLGKDGLPETSLDRLRELGQRISTAERRAMIAERETHDRLIAAHLRDRIGASFKGRVSGVTAAGLFVKLDDTGADGFVPAATLGRDFYGYEPALQAMIGQRTGEAWRLGDAVEVRLEEAVAHAGSLRFSILSEGRMMQPTGTGKRGRKRAVAGFARAAGYGRSGSHKGRRSKR
jgi:ribonuclease R